MITSTHELSDTIAIKTPLSAKGDTMNAFTELERGTYAALTTYSNVHRGSGHNSMVSTYLYEQARTIVLEFLKLNTNKFVVIFCTPRRAEKIIAQLKLDQYHTVSSHDYGLALGVRALAIQCNILHKLKPFHTGGGTARLLSPEWIIWAKAPDLYEPGTPAIINIIAFAKALRMICKYGKDIFHNSKANKLTAADILENDNLEQRSGRELLHELRHTLIEGDSIVPTSEGTREFINLDNSASTPAFEPIWDVVCRTWRQPSDIKQEIISNVTSICAHTLGAPLNAYDIIFTSNTTEAINLITESMSIESGDTSQTVILNTFLEHNSNELPWRIATGFSLIRLHIDTEGFIDLNELETHLQAYNQKGQHGKKRIKLVTISGASNVLGVYNDLQEICRIAHQYGALVLVDAAQLIAHREINMETSGIDFLAFSAHKTYAPFGSGALVARKELLNFSSSEREQIKLSGEENATGIAALGKSLQLLQRIGMNVIREEERILTTRALDGLAKIPGCTIYGIQNRTSPGFKQKGGVIVFDLKPFFSNHVADELARRGGIGVRYGCHCAHILIKQLLNIPPLLKVLQAVIATLFPKVQFPGLTRVSFGIGNSTRDVDRLLEELVKIANKTETGNSSLNKKEFKKQMADFMDAASRNVYSVSSD